MWNSCLLFLRYVKDVDVINSRSGSIFGPQNRNFFALVGKVNTDMTLKIDVVVLLTVDHLVRKYQPQSGR